MNAHSYPSREAPESGRPAPSNDPLTHASTRVPVRRTGGNVMRYRSPSLSRSILTSCALAAAAALGACGSSAFPDLLVPSDASAQAQEVAELSVTPGTVNVLDVGDVVQMSATAADASGNGLTDVPIEWSTADLSVATVSAGGVVTGVGQGRTTVTASVGGVSATANVTVGLTPGLNGTP